ncbi:metal-sensing transcriptional repressor, partial [Streptomyces doudnae]
MTTTETTGTGAEPTAPSAAEEVVTDHDRGIHGYHYQKDEHLKRLRRIEGQIRGLQRMV